MIKLLNDRNDDYWFCPDCAKPTLTATFIDKDIEEKCQNFFKTLESKIIKLEHGYENMSNLLTGKVESVKFSEHVQQNTTKTEELESNVASLKGNIKSLQENHQHLSNQEKFITVVDNNSESNVNSEILINDSVSIATQISKSINDRVKRASKVIVFNLKEQDDKQKDKVLVGDLCSFIIGKETSFKCTHLGSIKSTSIRPAKTEFTNPLIKNDFMRNLNKLKGAPTKFKNVSIKHDMTPEERLKERLLLLKTKELNNEIQNDDSKNGFYVVRGPIC